MKVVVVDKELSQAIFENIDSVSDTVGGKLILIRDSKTVAVFNKECWASWRKSK